MRYKWLNQNKNKKIILFFNGWGMDECIVKHLDCEDYDVLMFYDYNTLDADFDFNILNSYSEKNLVAWSMGVMIVWYLTNFIHHLNNFSHQEKRVCINGTLSPIDVQFGIHPKIYDLTINGFNEKGRERFISSMFNDKQEIICSRTLENQHSELIALKELSTTSSYIQLLPSTRNEGKTFYNKIIISDNDRIIPTKSQVAFWEIEPNLKEGHCPFFRFKKWSELL